ncbi:MAG: Hsp20/alpha crystallin family protein [Gaiellaceae bacterium]
MELARWTPFQELDSIERRLRRVLEDVGFAPTLLPAADVFETADELVLEIEVPGYDEKELTIEVTDHTLTVRGEQAKAVDEARRSYRLHERLERTFERRFPLPDEVDTGKLRANFCKGILEVHAKKIRAAKPKTVPIAAKKT